MTLDALRCFCAVIDAGSFRAAADRVFRSQPAVSQQVRGLEKELGHTFVDRKTCAPTPAGRLLYARAQPVLNQSGDIVRELADFDESRDHELRIGASDTTALYFLPGHIKAFARRMPETRVVVTSRSSGEIAAEVRHGRLELAIVTLPVEEAELEVRELFAQQMVLVVRKGHSVAGLRRVRLERLANESFVMLQSSTRTGAQLQQFFASRQFIPRTAVDSGSFEVIKRYVAEGVGLAFLPEMVVTQRDRSQLAAIRIEGLPTVRIGAVWRRGAYQSRAAKAFLDLLAPSPAKPRSRKSV